MIITNDKPQQNANHYHAPHPGNFTIRIGSSDDDLTFLAAIPDNTEGNLSVYSIDVPVPADVSS